ncbi:hypothetical protein, partial [Rhizobium sp. J15]|uniref:hypothetical protein n=1 Tax=Rhizobium sp. J15 TaxID=2035450 RepID=UPI001AECD4F8
LTTKTVALPEGRRDQAALPPSLAMPFDAGLLHFRKTFPTAGPAALLPSHRVTATQGEWFAAAIRRILLRIGGDRPQPEFRAVRAHTDEIACLAEEAISAAIFQSTEENLTADKETIHEDRHYRRHRPHRLEDRGEIAQEGA